MGLEFIMEGQVSVMELIDNIRNIKVVIDDKKNLNIKIEL